MFCGLTEIKWREVVKRKEGAGTAVCSHLSVPASVPSVSSASVSSDSCSVSDVRTKASKCQMHSLTPPFLPPRHQTLPPRRPSSAAGLRARAVAHEPHAGMIKLRAANQKAAQLRQTLGGLKVNSSTTLSSPHHPPHHQPSCSSFLLFRRLKHKKSRPILRS